MLYSMEMNPPGTADPASGQTPRPNSWTLAIVLVLAMALFGALTLYRPGLGGLSTTSTDSTAKENWSPSTRPAGQTVSMTIDFGNGARREFAALAYRDGMTVGDLMRQARDFRPQIRFALKGEGEMSFLTSLENVANEGGGGRNWLYSVDGKTGETSFEVCPLTPGAAVLWEFRQGE